MLAAADVFLTDLAPATPVGYADLWAPLAVAAVALVVAYYAVVLWATRRRAPRTAPSARTVVSARRAALTRLETVGAEVAAGRTTPRGGHQQVSDTVRGYVATVSGRPVRTMTLADVRRDGPPALADLLAEVYPPEFAPEDRVAEDRFDDALARARDLVATWT